MICRVFLVFLFCTFLLGNIANANVFSWVDEKGNVHFGDHPRVENAKKINPLPNTSPSKTVNSGMNNEAAVKIPPGREGVMEALRKGLIRTATQSDYSQWRSNIRDTSKLPADVSLGDSYFVYNLIEFTESLAGANAVTIFVPSAKLIPKGDLGHCRILIIDTGDVCFANRCGSLN